MTKSWGVIFDFDGVVVDTIRHHELCWLEVAKEQNKSVTHEQYVSGFGVKNARFIREILGWTSDPKEIEAISKRKEALFQARVADVQLHSGFRQFLEMLNKHDVPCAIASSSILKNIDLVLKRHDIQSYFAQIVSGEDVSHGKPDPECFIKAAMRLKLEPQRTVVIEDALLGIEAATKAGCKSIGITTTFQPRAFEQLPYRADKIIDSFNELTFGELDSWFQ